MTTLVVIANGPRPGRIETRLIRPCAPEEALPFTGASDVRDMSRVLSEEPAAAPAVREGARP
ncbi:hypothetical protein F8R89_27410 [Streptomyces sp. SS1-1]|uniref:hypothetical protein n=1 Tax=Streptomyces sp. SS1-1 TaxID=2651869 RepID=UPI00124F780F|nr:hypothetical protein [Streptomyces sp. SS1-1]KAB2975400.1 hypothetical protein F8R89_27410 [Streptomyces sp. SS1-1]